MLLLSSSSISSSVRLDDMSSRNDAKFLCSPRGLDLCTSCLFLRFLLFFDDFVVVVALSVFASVEVAPVTADVVCGATIKTASSSGREDSSDEVESVLSDDMAVVDDDNDRRDMVETMKKKGFNLLLLPLSGGSLWHLLG